MQGWIKLHRKFLEWEWFSEPKMVKLFMYLLLSANHEDGKWQGIEIKRGQLITGLHSLSKKTGISFQSLRTCLSKLERTGEITQKTTNKNRVITLCGFDTYQSTAEQPNNQSTINQQTTNKQSTTNKNDKNDKNDKKTTFLPDSIEVRLAEYLFKHIVRIKPDHKKPNIQSWAKHIDLMIRIDKRKPEAIKKVIEWCQNDQFWQTVILSTSKLRKQFDKLEMKSNETLQKQELQQPKRSACGSNVR